MTPNWTDQDDRVIASIWGPRAGTKDQVPQREIQALFPGVDHTAVRNRWQVIVHRVFQAEDGSWHVDPPNSGATTAADRASWPRPKGYPRAVMDAARAAAPKGCLLAIQILGMSGEDMRPLMRELGMGA